MRHIHLLLALLIAIFFLIPAISADWVYNSTGGYYTYISGGATYVMVNHTGTATFSLPSNLLNNNIYSLVIVGSGGKGGDGYTPPLNYQGGLGGYRGFAGTVLAQSSYSATLGTIYTLSIPQSAPATAFGYSAQSGTPGGNGGQGSDANGGNGNYVGQSGYTGYSVIPVAASGANGGAGYGTVGGSGTAGGTGFGAGGGAGGGGGSSYNPGVPPGTGGTGGLGAPGYITFYYFNTVGTPVTASFTETPGSGPAPLFVQFNDTSTGTTPASSWLWNSYFQNNGTLLWSSTLQNPSYTYPGGSYSVTMTATNAYGSATAPTQYVSSGNVVLQPAFLCHFDGMWT